MKLEFVIMIPKDLSVEERSDFEVLLKKQGQIDTVKGKLERCFKVCLVRLNEKCIGIGALKQVYKNLLNTQMPQC